MDYILNSYNLNKAVIQDQELLASGGFATGSRLKVQENINKLKFASLAIMVLESDIIIEKDKKMIVKLLILGEYDVAMKTIEKYVL